MGKKFSRIAAVGVMAATVLAIPASASAATSQRDVDACVDKFFSSTSALADYRYNNCGGRSLRLKIVISWGDDSDCQTLDWHATGSKDSFRHTFWTGSFDRLKAC